MKDVKIFGKSEQTQDPPPSPENPQPIRNVGKYNEGTGKYEIGINVSGRNIFDMDYILDDNMLNSNYSKSVEIKPFKVRKGHKYLLITKGLNYNNSYSAIIFGELDLKYLKLETYVLHFGQNKSFSENKQVRKVVEATRDCLITNVIVHGANNMDNAYEVKEFGVFEIFESENTENIPYEPYREPQTLTLTLDRQLTKWDKLEKRDGVYGWVYKTEMHEDIRDGNIEVNNIGATLEDSTRYYIRDIIGYKGADCINNIHPGLGFQYSTKFGGYIPNIYTGNDATTDTQTAIKNFKEKILSKGLTVYYEKSEAEFIPLPQSEQDAIRALSTYYPTTVITVDGGEVYGGVEVTYTADTKNYIDNQIKAVTGKQIETNKLMLERMI